MSKNTLDKSPPLRIAHISDLHFSKITLNPVQFFSKRWLGNLNLICFRKKSFQHDRLNPLIDFLKNSLVKHVVITGDLTTTSLQKEYIAAADFLSILRNCGFQTFTLPGNHDHYTKTAYRKKQFYNFFNTRFSHEQEPLHHYNLKEHGVTAKKLSDKWWLILMDTALATSLQSSQGLFSPNVENHLTKLLSLIPSDRRIILANHFPLFNNESERKALLRRESLQDLIRQFPNIVLYLHGHTHRQSIADLRKSGLPIILDSGSTTNLSRGSGYILDIHDTHLDVKTLGWDGHAWKITSNHIFQL